MIIKPTPANNAGKRAEDIAATHLLKQGLKLLEQNYHSRFGEIDIITIDKQCLVFIEVRYRKSEKYMSVVETIDKRKCKKIIITSEYYLNQQKKYQSYQCRYDVIAITGQLDTPSIEWIKNAFQA